MLLFEGYMRTILKIPRKSKKAKKVRKTFKPVDLGDRLSPVRIQGKYVGDPVFWVQTKYSPT